MLTKENTVILACSSMLLHVEAAQRKMQTDFPVLEADREYHVDPTKMKRCLQTILDNLPKKVENVLAAMAYCGGSWDGIEVKRRIVIPNMDDCITMLLNTDDRQHANLKQKGHMYIRDSDKGKYSIRGMKEELCRDYGMEFGTMVFGSYFQNYTNVDIIDTGVYDCYSEEFAVDAQENADLIRCALDYVPGSNLILEKLVSGRWDEQFVVFEKGEIIGLKAFRLMEGSCY
ncbi:MAG: DUF1638 domain-containing protein [Ruminococcus sp.]|jgi:hypothetical protein